MKKNIIHIFTTLFLGTLLACGSDIKHGYVDLDDVELNEEVEYKINHPAMLHTADDLKYVKSKVDAGAQPWLSGWEKLTSNSYASEGYISNPVAILVRGDVTGTGVPAENYANAFRDVAAAYQLALRWKISGEDKYAETAIKILNAWATTCKEIQANDANQYLAAGIYGYQFANAAEIMRDYAGWAEKDFTAYKQWMVDVFYSKNKTFLDTHGGMCETHYWTNWDVCNMASILAIGILNDDQSKIKFAINYFKNGIGTGNIQKAVTALHTVDGQVLGQGQESGRDQGHATLVISLYGAFCQMAYNIGEDLFAYDNNKILALCEYTAKYNVDMNNTVPFKEYTRRWNSACKDSEVHTAVSSAQRGSDRPSWELIYNHYEKIKGLKSPYSKEFATKLRPEGGGGHYGPNSGGFDQLGFGTLMFTRE